MFGSGTQQFDLYDIFSVFVPGVALLLGLTPLLPQFVPLTSLQFIVPLLVGGYIAGRGVHAGSVRIEEYFGRPSHRDVFINEVIDPEILDEDVVSEFCMECVDVFDIIDKEDLDEGLIPEEEEPPQEKAHDWKKRAYNKLVYAIRWLLGRDEKDRHTLGETLYVLVRSYVHIDSRGRSRTFQAIYSFYRGMWIVMGFLGFVYLFYGLADAAGLLEGIASFQTHLGTVDLHPGLVILLAETTYFFGYELFSKARSDYQEYFVQYLISDFLVIGLVEILSR